MQYSFNLYNSFAKEGVFTSLVNLLPCSLPPVVLCVGSDRLAGDSLGPVCGSLLAKKSFPFPFYVYGTLSSPVTAKEVATAKKYLKRLHPNQKIIAVDAAVGKEGEVGLIQVQSAPLYPGSGAGKKFSAVGDLSILGIVAEKSLFNYTVLSNVRANVIYRMAEIISEGIFLFAQQKYATQKSVLQL